MAVGPVNRALLESNFQNPGQIYLDTKTEGAFDVVADQVDENAVIFSSNGSSYITATPIAGLTGPMIYDQLFALYSQVQYIMTVTAPPYVGVPAYLARPPIGGGADDTANLQTTISAAGVTGGIVWVPPGLYIVNGTLNIPSNVTLMGCGRGVTTFKRTVDGDVIHIFGDETAKKSNINISGITFEMNNQLNSTGMYLAFTEKVKITDCDFFNMDHWGIWIGVLDGADTEIRNDNIVIEDCYFDNSSITYEHILIFNAQNVHVNRCHIKNGANSNGVGIYQNCDSISVTHNEISYVKHGIYYSLSTNNLYFHGNKITHCSGTAIQGANQSDNGSFGANKVYGLRISGGYISQNAVGLQLGAVVGATVTGVLFEYNTENALVINAGNSPVDSNSNSISITSCVFRNNNFGAGPSTIHPGILFASGNNMYTTIADCLFYDDQSPNTQLYPISFVNAQTYTDVLVTNCRLSSYGGAQSVGKDGSATIGTNVKIIYGMDVSSTNATGVVVI